MHSVVQRSVLAFVANHLSLRIDVAARAKEPVHNQAADVRIEHRLVQQRFAVLVGGVDVGAVIRKQIQRRLALGRARVVAVVVQRRASVAVPHIHIHVRQQE